MKRTKNKVLEDFADRIGLSYQQVMYLHRAAEDAFNTEDKGLSQDAIERATKNFEKIAAKHGFTVSWPGLWPLLHKDGQDVFLPD